MKEVKAQGPYYTAWIGDALVGYGPSPEVMRVRDIVEVRFYATGEDMEKGKTKKDSVFTKVLKFFRIL